MSSAVQRPATPAIAIEIGGTPVLMRTAHAGFRELLASRYAGFLSDSPISPCEFEVEIVEPVSAHAAGEDLQVQLQDGQWRLKRGDFRAQFDPRSNRGWIRQSANPYSVDSVLRVVHSLLLAREGGFLLHSASAIRNGRAFLFSGVSGAGKTTISRLVPRDAKLLTDEVSYLRRDGECYRAFGTPFAGELARVGENCSAPVEALYFLEKGPENRIEPVGAVEATGALLRNILFFAQDPGLVRLVFQAACDFVDRIPAYRLFFVPDERVWELIR
jgi:hypothetical protein